MFWSKLDNPTPSPALILFMASDGKGILCTSWCLQSYCPFFGWCSFVQQASFVDNSELAKTGCVVLYVVCVCVCVCVCTLILPVQSMQPVYQHDHDDGWSTAPSPSVSISLIFELGTIISESCSCLRDIDNGRSSGALGGWGRSCLLVCKWFDGPRVDVVGGEILQSWTYRYKYMISNLRDAYPCSYL